MQGEVAAADARRAGAAVGLEHVAVDDDLALAERDHVARRPQAAPDQALDLDGAPALLARAASRSTRSGDEPGSIEYSAVTQPLPVPRIQRGTSSSTLAVHSTRVRPNDTRHDPVGHLGEVALERDRAQLVGGAAVGAGVHRGRSRRRCPRVGVVQLGPSRRAPSSRNACDVAARQEPVDAGGRSSVRSRPSSPSVRRAAKAVSSAELTSVTSRPITSPITPARNG